MAELKLPLLADVTPVRINAQTRIVDKSSAALSNGRTFIATVRLKLSEGANLSPIEIGIAIVNFKMLLQDEVAELQRQLATNPSIDVADTAVEVICENLGPIELCGNSFASLAKNCSNSISKTAIIDILSNPRWLAELNAMMPRHHARGLLALKLYATGTLSTGQTALADVFLNSGHLPDLFENDFEDLLILCRARHQNELGPTLQVIDQILENLIGADSDAGVLEGKIFDERLGYQKTLTLTRERPLTGYPNIKKLQELVDALDKHLEQLSTAVPERGEYWRKKRKYASRIESHKGTSAYNIGVAFQIGQFVFCEFGPTGNSIYVYRLKEFEQIRRTRNWKAKDLTYKNLSFDGRILHMSGWQDEVDKLLIKLRNERNG